MFKKLSVALLVVLLSTTAFAQTKKKRKKKPKAKQAVEQTLPETPPADTMDAADSQADTAMAEPAHAPKAAGQISQYNWQPGDGQSAFETGLFYGMASVQFTQNGIDAQKNETTGLRVGLGYHFGFTGSNSVGVTTAYTSSTTKATPTGGTSTDTKKVGLEDIFIESRNFSSMGGGKFLYGAKLGFGLAKRKDGSATEDGNNSSGGLSLPIYFGYESDMGGSAWGVRLDYGLLFERTYEVSSTTDGKLSGGNPLELRGYYESGTETYWNAYLGYGMVSDTDVKVGTTTTKVKSPSYVPFGFSWGTHMSPGMLLALHYDGDYYMKVERTDLAAGVESSSFLAHSIGVRARWEF